MEKNKLFSVNGFWKNDKVKFSNHIISENEYTEDISDDEDDKIFFYGMSEQDIQNAIELKWGSEQDFVITSYTILN